MSGRTREGDVFLFGKRVLRREQLGVKCHSRLRAEHVTITIGASGV